MLEGWRAVADDRRRAVWGCGLALAVFFVGVVVVSAAADAVLGPDGGGTVGSGIVGGYGILLVCTVTLLLVIRSIVLWRRAGGRATSR